MRPAALALLAPLAAVVSALAGGPDVHGHVKVQPTLQLFRDDDVGALLVGERAEDVTLDLRLDTVWRRSRWDLAADGELVGLAGDTLRATESPLGGALAGALLGAPAPEDPHQWLDLTRTLSAGSSRLVYARLDRLSVGYTGDRFVMRLGRQALSWGNGLVFQVLDLFDPFPPTVIDTDYKPGTDMLTTQWMLGGSDDLQAIAVPRRPAPGRDLAADESSLAVKWHHVGAGPEVELLAARHFGDTVGGAGASGNLAGGVWRVDASVTALAGGGTVVSAVANLDRSWVWGGRNAYTFVEYFRNGFGVTSLERDATTLPASLIDRLARGELFTLGRDELATGLQLDCTPLLRLAPAAIVNLHDASSMLLLRVTYDWRQNLKLDAGVQAGLGPRDTEYGGVPVAAADAFLAPGRLVWVRLARYF